MTVSHAALCHAQLGGALPGRQDRRRARAPEPDLDDHQPRGRVLWPVLRAVVSLGGARACCVASVFSRHQQGGVALESLSASTRADPLRPAAARHCSVVVGKLLGACGAGCCAGQLSGQRRHQAGQGRTANAASELGCIPSCELPVPMHRRLDARISPLSTSRMCAAAPTTRSCPLWWRPSARAAS